MAEIKVERKRGPGAWVWILLAVVLAVLLWALFLRPRGRAQASAGVVAPAVAWNGGVAPAAGPFHSGLLPGTVRGVAGA